MLSTKNKSRLLTTLSFNLYFAIKADMKLLRTLLLLFFLLTINIGFGQKTIRIGLLKYKGGGDWYANPTSLPNLIKYCNEDIKTNIKLNDLPIEVGSNELFDFPFVHMTGHGNVIFSESESENLRNYLVAGGFLHIDDNYGMDKYVRREMKKVFPELEFIELPFTHPIYHQKYKFKDGLPKIHEHDAKRPQGFGLLHEGRLVCFYSYECDLGDGWEDAEVHNDSEEKRLEALKMGANIISYCFNQ